MKNWFVLVAAAAIILTTVSASAFAVTTTNEEHDLVKTNVAAEIAGSIEIPAKETPVSAETTAEPVRVLPHTHTFVTKQVTPTCTEEGYVSRACKCGNEIFDRVPATGHVYCVIEEEEPTTKENGHIIYQCSTCGYTYRIELDKLPEPVVPEPAPDPTDPDPKPESFAVVFAADPEPVATEPKKDNLVTDAVLKRISDAAKTDMCGEPLWWSTRSMPEPLAKVIGPMLEGVVTSGNPVRAKMLPEFTYEEALNWYQRIYLGYTYGVSLCGDFQNEDSEFVMQLCEGTKTNSIERIFVITAGILDELRINEETTQLEALGRINEYLCVKKHYEDAYSYNGLRAEYALTSDTGICMDYALAFQALCLACGIDCDYIRSNAMGHAWNMVHFSDGSSYHIDCCWNDAQYNLHGTVVETDVANGVPETSVREIRNRYFLLTTEEISADHPLD